MDDQGITINLAGFNSYYLAWTEISSIVKRRKIFPYHDSVEIQSDRSKQIISTQPWFMKIYFYLNRWFANDYFVIPIEELSIASAGNISDVYNTLQGHWKTALREDWKLSQTN